ncbi:MAG: hypothetical protein H6726_04545 [Sandaracinaceae bacterium]|nr:hypothetical protein [Sandaracinaceae bacterium]
MSPIHSAVAFRCAPRLAQQASDFVRVHDGPDGTLVLMANAVDAGFATCWPPGSRLLLDAFLTVWPATEGAVEARLGETFARVAQRFAAEAPGLRTPMEYDDDELPYGQLLAAWVTPHTVHAAWVGTDVMLQARRGELVGSTRPHTLLHHLMDQRPDEPFDHANVPYTVARVLGGRTPPYGEPSAASFQTEPGDTLVFLNGSMHRGRAHVADSAARGARQASPERVAEWLADAGIREESPAYTAVAVLRLGPTEER